MVTLLGLSLYYALSTRQYINEDSGKLRRDYITCVVILSLLLGRGRLVCLLIKTMSETND